ncbi:MAG: ribonuclease P protein component [Bacteroidales bacterium]|nr:ribonuclease P protein component [Bacteroidales bacterium]
MQKTNTLGKTERLKSFVRIDKLFNTGRSFMTFPFIVYYTIGGEADTDCDQMMVTVSKHYFKHAVDRNHIKRLTREAYRVRKSQLQNLTDKHFSIAFVYKCRHISTFDAISAAMDTILSKFAQLLGEGGEKAE